MPEHDKIEHELPNGDVLVEDSTQVDPEVEEAFSDLREDFERMAQESMRELSRDAQ